MTKAAQPSSNRSSKLTRLASAAEIPEKGVRQVRPTGFDAEFAVYKLDGEYYCSDDICTHGLVSLSNGDIEDGQIFCPLHGGAFDIRTGAATALPCRMPLKVYKVEQIGDDLYADLS